MTASQIIQLIREGVNTEFIPQNTCLVEELEQMSVPFYKDDSSIVLIKPDDCEKRRLWACFSNNTEREIADYIGFCEVNNQPLAFIFELKKTKSNENNKKARKQILSTLPLVKMIYEKTTGLNPKDLKIIGIRVFGPNAGRRQGKQKRTDARAIDDNIEKDNLVLSHYVQSNISSNLSSLKSFYKLVTEKYGDQWICRN